MLYPDLTDVPIEVFGGYCPSIPPSELSPGAAAVATDVVFPQGAVRSRGGLKNFFPGSPISGTASINGLKTYLTPTLAQRLMVWDSFGNLYKESPQGTIGLVGSRPYKNLFYQSQTLFGREYQALFNAAGGFDIPRQYDDTNWDRVSQSGPGVAPTAGDENISQAINAAPNGLLPFANLNVQSGLESGFLVTLVVQAVSGLIAGNIISSFKSGDLWQIAGVGAGYNGTFAIGTCTRSTTVPTQLIITYLTNVGGLAPVGAAGTSALPYYTVVNNAGSTVEPPAGVNITIAGAGVGTYNALWAVRFLASPTTFVIILPNNFGVAASGGGTWVIAGNVAAGLHQVSVCYITRQNFITAPAVPPTTFNAAGSKRVVVGNIAAGPSNVIARLLIFTPVITPPATTGSFYSLPTGSSQIPTSAMLIQDNTTTQVTVDFSDAILIAGFQANYLFTQLVLGESAFTIGYNSRMAWLGERAKLPNLINLDFDGGYLVAGGSIYPSGWTPDSTNFAGGSSATGIGDWANGYSIFGQGPAISGKISQSAYQDYLGIPIINVNTGYGVRVRLAFAGTVPTQGVFHINLQSTSGAFTTVGLAVNATALTGSFQEFIANLTDTPLSSPPSDLKLQVYCDGTLTTNTQIIVDSIEPFPLNNPYNYSTARFSHAFNPESYDGTTGQVQIRPSDGQQLRAGFPLRNNLYLAKDHYLCYVTDDGVNEPSSWAVNEVSGTIGICGPNAVDWTEEWAVFAERAGLHMCWGSDPVKISPEIQNSASGAFQVSWSSINWAAAYTMWVRIDKVNKMILVGAPVNGATTPNVVFMLDYRWLDGASDIASSPLVTYSSFTGKILSHGRGRRWALWNMTINSMTFAERLDGTAQPLFGNGTANGIIYQQLDCAVQASDDGTAVDARYRTYATPSHMEEQMYRFSAHRKLLGYLKFAANGVGNLNLSITTVLRTTNLRPYALSLNPAGDGERPVNLHGERFYISVETNAVGSWFQLEKLIPCLKKDATIPVRGVSA